MKLALLFAGVLACWTPVWAATTMRADDARVARMGRTLALEDGALRFGYPGVSLSVNFEGTSLDIEAGASDAKNFLDIVVDGAPPRRVRLAPATGRIVLVKDAAAGKHRVDVVNGSEAWLGLATVARFHTDGSFAPAPALPARKMLVLGDSVTCAEAIERVPGEKKNSSWWKPLQSYGMLAARELQAQVQLVCHGGRGLVRRWDGRTDDPNLIDFYEQTIAAKGEPARWDHSQYQPDLIVSAIGTNDFAVGIPDREVYVQAYVKLVETLLRHHPRAQIVLTESAILKGERKAALTAYIAETVRRVGSARVHAAPSAHHPGEGNDGHPTGPQHAAMARELLPYLRSVTGW